MTTTLTPANSVQTLRLDDADDLLGAVNITDLEPDDFTRAHAAAISQRQHHARLQIGGHRQNALDLLLAQHQRHLDRLLQTEDLGHQVVPSKRHAKQEFDASHGLIAGADARAGLHQMPLEIPHIIRCGRLGRAPEPSRKTLAGAQVTGL